MKLFRNIVGLVIIFLISVSVFCEDKTEKDTVLDNFFNTVKQMNLQQIVINTMETDVEVEVKLSPMLEPYVKSFFSKGVPPVLKSKGYLRNVFRNIDNKYEVEYSYLYQDTSMGDIVISRMKDNINVLLPSLGIIINDTLPEIKAVVNQYVPLTEQPNSPFDTTYMVITYLKNQEKSVREKIKFERNGTKAGIKTHIYSYPVDNGKILLEIYDGIWTIATITFDGINNMASTYIQIEYPVVKDTSNLSMNLPNSFILKGQKEGTEVVITLSNIKYNKLLSNSDFEIAKMNFQEFIATMYLKYVQGQY
ncbi:MAG: hypothetical protein N3D17_01310 [bacterium]|nr:hypothetical protein [bacterium]